MRYEGGPMIIATLCLTLFNKRLLVKFNENPSTAFAIPFTALPESSAFSSAQVRQTRVSFKSTVTRLANIVMDPDRPNKCLIIWPPYQPGVLKNIPRANRDEDEEFKWKAELRAPFNNLKAWTDTIYSINILSFKISFRPTFKEIKEDVELSRFPVRDFNSKTLSALNRNPSIGIGTAVNLMTQKKLWKWICLSEIPSKYLLEMLGKRYNGELNVDLIIGREYKNMYSRWRMWQRSKMGVSNIGRQDYISDYGVCKLLCQHDELLLVLGRSKWTYSLSTDKGNLVLKHKKYEPHKLGCLMVVNPKTLCAASVHCSDEKFVGFDVRSVADFPLQYEMQLTSKHLPVGRNAGQLLDVDANAYESKCCMVREIWFGFLGGSDSKPIHEHYCLAMKATKFVSVVHQLILGLLPNNALIIHNMSQNVCMKISRWLPDKYIEATAVYVYTNLLIVGTRNSYLLAYRLKDWNDFRNLTPRNLVLNLWLNIGPIISLEIANYKKCAAIFAASVNSVMWVNLS